MLVFALSACKKEVKQEEVASSTLTLKLISPADGATLQAENPAQFNWFSSSTNNAVRILHKIKIVEITGDQSPEQAVKSNTPFFEKEGLIDLNIFLPYDGSSTELVRGKKYAWRITATQKDLTSTGGESEVSTFTVAP